MRNIAIIIPARGGSKGVPNKNLVMLDNKPLVDHTINFAKKLNHEVFLTSDSKSIFEKLKNNINCIERPKNLATDHSRINDTLLHAAEEINKKIIYDSLLVLQPTFLIEILKK